jgi:hypothetical protein
MREFHQKTSAMTVSPPEWKAILLVHLDGCKVDNRPGNLKWLSNGEAYHLRRQRKIEEAEHAMRWGQPGVVNSSTPLRVGLLRF